MPRASSTRATSGRHRGIAAVGTWLFACIVLLLACGAAGAAEPAPEPMRIVANGAEFHYVESGAGEPLILLHGGQGDYRSMAAQAEALSPRYRVIAYSRRFHHPNDNPIPPDHRSGYPDAADLGAFVSALGLGRVHLVGTSAGALTALLFAMDHPDQVRSLVLAEPPIHHWARNDAAGRPLYDAFMSAVWAPAGAAFRRGDDVAGMRALVDGFAGAPRFDGLPPAARAVALQNARFFRVATASPEPFPAVDKAIVARLRMPILIVTGEHTVPLHRFVNAELAKVLPRAERVTIAGAGHGAAREKPREFNAAVLGFLSRLEDPASAAPAGAAPAAGSATPTVPATVTAGDTAPAYPPARRAEVVDVFHGVEVRDPYRWMEDLRTPELAAWIAAQNERTEPLLRGGPVHAGAIARMQALTDLYPKQEQPRVAGAYRFYRAMVDDRIVLMVQGPGDAAPRPLVDAAALGKDGAVKAFLPSSDGGRVAYVVGPGGADWGEIRIRDVASGRELPVVLPNVRHTGPMRWSADGSGLLYLRYAPPRDGRREAQAEDPAVYLHRLGNAVDADLRLFALPADRRDWDLDFDLPGDRRRLVAYIERGPWHDGNLGGSRAQVHVLALGADGRPRDGATALALTDADAAYRVVHVAADRALVFTDKDAPRRRVVAMDLAARQPPAAWRAIVPEGKGVLTEARWIGGALVTHSIEDVKSAVRVLDADGGLVRDVPLPGTGIVERVIGQPESDEVVLLYSGLLQAPAFVRHALASGKTSVEVVSDAAPDLSAFEVSQEWFVSRDGTRVPMFVLARRGLVRDGSHPTILFGYGASSSSELPTLRPEAATWVQMGGVYAIANLRGGGEFGRAWYEAAIRERKQTTFDDMIAAAEYLVASGLTSPRRLAIHGASNGGLLVTAVMLQRPDLFGAVLADVPVTDAMRRHLAGNGAQQVEQWGSPEDAAVFPALRAYSPVHNVVAGTCYPPTLITTSHDDERLPAWHAYKFAAALQAGQGCDAPILLRSRASGGHAGGGPSAWVEDVAAQLTFAARHLGLQFPSPGAGAPSETIAAPVARNAGQPADAFMDRLRRHCGQAFAGRVIADTPPPTGEDPFAGKALVMHVRGCEAKELRIPFHVGDDRSRTWILTRTASGLRLKHDHRHADGTPDASTMYGGDTAAAGSERRQAFPVDAALIALFEATGRTASTTNTWAMEIEPGQRFLYELSRPGGRLFQVEFDLTRPIALPPPPWGHE